MSVPSLLLCCLALSRVASHHCSHPCSHPCSQVDFVQKQLQPYHAHRPAEGALNATFVDQDEEEALIQRRKAAAEAVRQQAKQRAPFLG